jgi:hypothetical protein
MKSPKEQAMEYWENNYLGIGRKSIERKGVEDAIDIAIKAEQERIFKITEKILREEKQ